MRFKILEDPMKNYPIEAQKNIVLICYVLNNFIKEMQPYDHYMMDPKVAPSMDWRFRRRLSVSIPRDTKSAT